MNDAQLRRSAIWDPIYHLDLGEVYAYCVAAVGPYLTGMRFIHNPCVGNNISHLRHSEKCAHCGWSISIEEAEKILALMQAIT